MMRGAGMTTTEVNVVGVYTDITFDFKLDPATAPAKDGTFGTLNIGLVTDGWATSQQGTYTIPANATNWTHVTIPINPTTAGADKTVGEYINMWSGGNYTNTLSFNVDNIYLQPSTNAAPLPPPTMALEKAGPSGVEIIMDGTGDQWQRNGISTPAGGGPYLWTSQGTYPVSYSCTITNFPDIATHLGFEAHMYLVNLDTAPCGSDTSGSPDWGVPDLLIFRVENSATNVFAQIQWKTNYPNANATNVPVAVYRPQRARHLDGDLHGQHARHPDWSRHYRHELRPACGCSPEQFQPSHILPAVRDVQERRGELRAQ